jgi:hypothetical protein
MFKAIRAAADDRHHRLATLREAAIRLSRPLHRRSATGPLGQRQVIAHAEFVAIAQHRRAGQREHEAVGELEPSPVAAQHRREPSPDAAVVKLVLQIGTEGFEHALALLFGEPSEVELVVIAQEDSPLPTRRPLFGFLHRPHERPRVGTRQCVEQVLVDLEIEHHVHAIAVVAEILHVGFWQDVRFREDDGIADAPLQEFAQSAEHGVLLARLADVGTFGADDEGHGIHAKAGNAKLNPEAHDLEDLGLHRGIGRVEVGLEVVEAVEVPFLRHRITRPGRFLYARKHHARVRALWTLFRPDVPVAILRFRIAARLLKPGMFVRRVIDDEIDDHADAALRCAMREFDKIPKRSEGRIDGVIIRDVVAVVFARRFLERHQPDRGYAQAAEIVEPAHQALEIADAVGVRIHVSGDRQTVKNRIFVPKVFDHPPRTVVVEMLKGVKAGAFKEFRCGWGGQTSSHLGVNKTWMAGT